MERSCNQILTFTDLEVLVMVEKGSATSRKVEDSPAMRRQKATTVFCDLLRPVPCRCPAGSRFAPTPNHPNC